MCASFAACLRNGITWLVLRLYAPYDAHYTGHHNCTYTGGNGYVPRPDLLLDDAEPACKVALASILISMLSYVASETRYFLHLYGNATHPLLPELRAIDRSNHSSAPVLRHQP